MALHVLHLHDPVLVPDVHGGLPGAIAMEAWKYRDGIINIKLFDFVVKVVNFVLFISVVIRLWAELDNSIR